MMAWQIGDQAIDVSQLPGRKRKSLNLWVMNEYVGRVTPLAYFTSEEGADAAEEFLQRLAHAAPATEVTSEGSAK